MTIRVGSRTALVQGSNGFSKSTSNTATTAALRVTRVRPWTLARRGQERIDDRHRANSTHPAPFLRNNRIDRQNAVAEARNHVSEPSFERFGLSGITTTRHFRTFAYLTQHQRAEPQIVLGDTVPPRCHEPIAAVTLTQLRDDVRVDQESHTVSSRPRSRGRSRSIPSRGAEASSALSSSERGYHNLLVQDDTRLGMRVGVRPTPWRRSARAKRRLSGPGPRHVRNPAAGGAYAIG